MRIDIAVKMSNRLGGLVGRPLLSYSLENYYYTVSPPAKGHRSRNQCILSSINRFPSLQVSQSTGDLSKDMYYRRRDKTREIEKIIGKGDIINMHDLLFTNDRDYLVKYNNQQVKAKQLEGKVIALLFVPLTLHPDVVRSDIVRSLIFSLMEIYNNLQSNNVFEVVFIGVKSAGDKSSDNKNSYKHFLEIFSFMPWAGIPFSDIPSGKNLQRRFGFHEAIEKNYSIYIIDSSGMVLQRDYSGQIIELYGALGYPFSDERMEHLVSEDNAIARQPSLSRILASPGRDYVISNKGEKVPIHTLDDKIVALFFYEQSPYEDSYAECLKIAYEELARNRKNFEVVLIYLTDTRKTRDITNEESFWKIFKSLPWLAVPFKDPIHKKLKRIFEYLPDWMFSPPGLVIFGPHGEFVEPYGKRILSEFGISAYPFTRAKLANLETERVKDLKLELLWDSNTVFRRKDGSQVTFSQLLGKRVILIFERVGVTGLYTRFLKMLKGMYQTKGTHDEFEVIHVFASKIDYAVGDVPWLVSLVSELLPGDFGLYSMFGREIPYANMVIAFDQDGRLVRRAPYPTFDIMEFPFCTLSLEEEALVHLNSYVLGCYYEYYPFGGQIYTARDKLLGFSSLFG